MLQLKLQFYYKQDANQNQPKEETPRKVREGSKHRASAHLLWSTGWHSLPPTSLTHRIETQHLKECCQPGKLTLVFGAQSFYWGSITYCPYGWPLVFNPSWKLGIITLVCSPSRGQNYYGDFHVPIIYHIVTLPITKGPGQTDTFLSDRTFQGTRDHLPVARGKGQTSPRLKVNLHYTKGLKTSGASLIILALKLPPIYNVRFLLNIEHCFPHYLYNFFFFDLELFLPPTSSPVPVVQSSIFQ